MGILEEWRYRLLRWGIPGQESVWSEEMRNSTLDAWRDSMGSTRLYYGEPWGIWVGAVELGVGRGTRWRGREREMLEV